MVLVRYYQNLLDFQPTGRTDIAVNLCSGYSISSCREEWMTAKDVDTNGVFFELSNQSLNPDSCGRFNTGQSMLQSICTTLGGDNESLAR